jgi:hypothetical protein
MIKYLGLFHHLGLCLNKDCFGVENWTKNLIEKKASQLGN